MLTKQNTVITLGPKGSYHNQAVNQIHKNIDIVFENSFEKIIKTLLKNKNQTAVIATKNSSTGTIVKVDNLLKKYSDKLIKINSTKVKVEHALICLQSSNLLNIKKVISHRQAIKQCSNFITKYNLKVVLSTSTSQAVLELIKKNDPSLAAIASNNNYLKTKVIATKIQNKKNNETEFIELKLK